MAAFVDMALEVLVPAHSTGWKAQHRLAAALPSAFVPNAVSTSCTPAALAGAGQPTADGDGGAEPPCCSLTVINRMISSRSAADGRPMPGVYP